MNTATHVDQSLCVRNRQLLRDPLLHLLLPCLHIGRSRGNVGCAAEERHGCVLWVVVFKDGSTCT